MYDAIVVGARCAGSPTAMLLARRGYRVLLVDRATFPSDTISTHGITHRGLLRLKKWGLYERLRATNCPEIGKRTIDLGDFPLTGYLGKADGLPAAFCPRRTILDKILLDAAAKAGAEVREGFSVRELVREQNGHVSGIKGGSRGTHLYTERARIIIGADGKHSLVARAVNAPRYKEIAPLMCWYYAYWTDLQENPHGFGTYTRQRRIALAIPTNDGLTCLLIGWPHAEFNRVRSDIESEYRQAVRILSPVLADCLQHSTRVEPYYGMADLPNFFRKPYGPGWALVGDAGYHKDPVHAHGIADALRDAELLADAVHAGLSGEMPLEQALSEYERLRNADAFPRYEDNCKSASFEPPPEEILRLRAALRHGDQADIDAFFNASAGLIPREQFFNAENLARILQRTPN